MPLLALLRRSQKVLLSLDAQSNSVSLLIRYQKEGTKDDVLNFSISPVQCRGLIIETRLHDVNLEMIGASGDIV